MTLISDAQFALIIYGIVVIVWFIIACSYLYESVGELRSARNDFRERATWAYQSDARRHLAFVLATPVWPLVLAALALIQAVRGIIWFFGAVREVLR